MIVSHAHRFVFLEVPQTGTTAIAKELCATYGAEEVLHKHAHLSEFRQAASPAERAYRVAVSLRHPLDRLYSYFLKLRNDHLGEFSDPGRFVENGGWVTLADRERLAFIRATDGDFGAYLRRFHVGQRPAISQYNWGKRRYDFTIRFERLNEDFHGFLRAMGVEPVRDLPAVNVTEGRERDFLGVYPEELRPEIRRVFGPLVREWGYELPASWGSGPLPLACRAQYAALNLAGRALTELLGITPRRYEELRRGRAAQRSEEPAR